MFFGFLVDLVWLKLLVDPVLGVALPGLHLGGAEPESDLLLSAVDGVRSVADVPTEVDTKVAPDGAGLGSQGVGLAQHDAALLDDVEALPDHGADGARVHVLDQAGEEGLGREVGVVLLQVLLAGLADLDGHQLVAAVFKSRDDVSDQAALDTVGLDGDEGAFVDDLGHVGLAWACAVSVRN